MLGNVLLKISTNGKFSWIDTSPYLLTVFFDPHSWYFQSDGQASLRSFQWLITSDVSDNIRFISKA